ncbi:MAG: hypothetical protein RL458_2650 [Pseudomonadota bacterium]
MECDGAAYPRYGPEVGSGFAFLCNVFAKFLQQIGVESGTISAARFRSAFCQGVKTCVYATSQL